LNYIQEINAFYDWLETNPIPDSAIVLWHALMHINNKAGWVPEFAVAISTLSTKTGLKKDAIIRARLRLQQAGRIDFKSRSGQQSAIYKIIPFASEKTTQSATQTAIQNYDIDHCVGLNDTNRNANREQTATQSTTQTASITKLNETKLNETKKKKSKTPVVPKIQYAEFVSMTEEEHSKLVSEFGETDTARLVEILNNYKGATGKRYKSDYLAIRNWVISRLNEEKQRQVRRIRPYVQDQLPISVQRQIEREREGQAGKTESRTAMDDPEFRAMLESFPKAEGRR